MAQNETDYKSRLLYVLSIYPKLSFSLLGMAMGSSLKTSDWLEDFDALVNEGKIQTERAHIETVKGRISSTLIYSLPQ